MKKSTKTNYKILLVVAFSWIILMSLLSFWVGFKPLHAVVFAVATMPVAVIFAALLIKLLQIGTIKYE